MWVITNKEDSAIFGFSDVIEQHDSGYSKLNDLGIVIKESDWRVYSVQEIPEEVIPGKYCYTEEKGFYENPNWVEPVEPDPTEEILQNYRESLAREVSENGYNA